MNKNKQKRLTTLILWRLEHPIRLIVKMYIAFAVTSHPHGKKKQIIVTRIWELEELAIFIISNT